jgi:hypothetical protein
MLAVVAGKRVADDQFQSYYNISDYERRERSESKYKTLTRKI